MVDMQPMRPDVQQIRPEDGGSVITMVVDLGLDSGMVQRNISVRADSGEEQAAHAAAETPSAAETDEDGRRTSVRLTRYVWDTLCEMSRRERISVDAIVSELAVDAEDQTPPDCYEQQVSLANAVRVFTSGYYRLVTEELERLLRRRASGDKDVRQEDIELLIRTLEEINRESANFG